MKWSPWVEFGGAYVTDDASRGNVALFAPLSQGPRDLLFIDARGRFFEEDAREANVALAYRQMLPNGWNLGAWIGGDVRRTGFDNTFWQLSGGFEALSENFDIRVNGYGPVTDPQAAGFNNGFTQVVLSGSSIYMIGGSEVGLRGIDGEVGVLVPTDALNVTGADLELRVYGGGFYFDHETAVQEVAGPKGRLELRFNDIFAGMPGSRLTAEYAYSYDEVRDSRHQIGARLRIPLGPPADRLRYASLTSQEQRMMDGLERDVDIVVVRSQAEAVEDALTDVDFDRVAYVDDGGSVTTTAMTAGGNSLIIATGGTISGEQFLQDSQTLQSGASTIQVRGLNSGTVANFTAPFSQTTLTANNENVMNLVSNTHLNGFIIDKTGNSQDDAVVARDAADNEGFSNFAITNNIITTTGDGSNAVGIDDDNDTVWVLGNTLTTAGFDAQGVEFGDDNSNVRIRGNTITTRGEAAYGIEVDDDNTNFWVSGNTIVAENFGAVGIWFDEDNDAVSVSSNVITMQDEFSDGIVFFAGNSNISLTDNSIATLADESFGIVVYAVNEGVTVTGNTVTTQGEMSDGIHFGFANDDIVVAENTVFTAGTESFGLHFEEANSNATVTGNALTTQGALAPGIFVELGNTGIDIEANTVSTEGLLSAGIALSQFNSDVSVSGNTVTTSGPLSAGVALLAFNDDVTVSGNSVLTSGALSAGVFALFDNGDATISGNTIVTQGPLADAISIGFGHDGMIVASNTLTTSGFGSDGIQIGADNSVAIAGNAALGTIADDFLDLFGTGNALSGTGNSTSSSTVAANVCETTSAFTGSVEIDGTTFTDANCP
jgi:Inverse autotransporter, beta-domain